MGYIDAQTLLNPTAGGVLTDAWCDQIRANQEYFAAVPSCSVFHSTTQSPASGAEQVMSANSETFDNDTMHSTSSNTSRITIVTAGKYEFWARVGWAANGTGYRRVNYKLDGGAAVTLDTKETVTTGGPLPTITSVNWSLTLSAAQYVEVSTAQLSGGALATELREFGCRWISR